MTHHLATRDLVPPELAELLRIVDRLPADVAQAIAPAVAEAVEQAWFRSRVLDVAKEALERLRLELDLTRFDLELTRKERDSRGAA